MMTTMAWRPPSSNRQAVLVGAVHSTWSTWSAAWVGWSHGQHGDGAVVQLEADGGRVVQGWLCTCHPGAWVARGVGAPWGSAAGAAWSVIRGAAARGWNRQFGWPGGQRLAAAWVVAVAVVAEWWRMVRHARCGGRWWPCVAAVEISGWCLIDAAEDSDVAAMSATCSPRQLMEETNGHAGARWCGGDAWHPQCCGCSALQ